jgi:charged multivesicular body protein 2A
MTPAERLRKHQRALEKTQRELDRERTKLEQQEKKLVADIKKNAKNGQMGAVKVQAKDLVRTRRYITKFYQMRTQLQAISLRIQVCRTVLKGLWFEHQTLILRRQSEATSR